MIEGLIYGLQTALATQNLIWILIGCSAGTLIGMMPGLGPITAIALMIPVSYNSVSYTHLTLPTTPYV